MSAVVEVRQLSKAYRPLVSTKDRIAAVLGLPAGARQVQALHPISFDIARGESVGLIGANGAGKSTLLKLLAGVSNPTTGQVAMAGRVSALLELGTGFHPDFTGRENMTYSALLTGMSREEIQRIEPEVLAFSELSAVIDDPIKTYSTGMQMRLAFSVAHAVAPDVLLVDEVLAVGDAYFQYKCHQRLESFAKSGGTFILVSHELGSILRMCGRALWLDQGELRMDGPAARVVEAYQDQVMADEERRMAGARPPAVAEGTTSAILELSLVDGSGSKRHQLRPGQPCAMVATVRLDRAVPQARATFMARRRDGRCLLELISEPMDLRPGTHAVRALFEPLRLGPGELFWSARLEAPGFELERGISSTESPPTPTVIVARPDDILERGGLRHSARWQIVEV